ncbi:hypothetical protein KAU85_01010 [Candidatus Bathyarchaeota archaeon]|nr:hypothetical protein [Candidatus Bathyarchaeota archaeon]MCK4482322.1 hypothetical protein [Candidatus Bathyarchaeota archaeon]
MSYKVNYDKVTVCHTLDLATKGLRHRLQKRKLNLIVAASVVVGGLDV